MDGKLGGTPSYRSLLREKPRCPRAAPTTPCSEPSGAKAAVLRPWIALTNASRAADGIHAVIVWRSPPATDVVQTKRLITRSRVQGCRASGPDAFTSGGNTSTLATLRRRDMACCWGLRVFSTVNGQDEGGCRATNLRYLATPLARACFTVHTPLMLSFKILMLSLQCRSATRSYLRARGSLRRRS